MGRIHEALKRAEEERARLQGLASPAAREAAREPRRSEYPVRARVELMPLGPLRAPLSLRPPQVDASVVDQYQLLRTRIQGFRRQRRLRSLVVVSADAGDGRTTTALELARAYGADSDVDTCLVDLDLRSPRIADALEGTVEFDVVDVIEGRTPLHAALVPVVDSRLMVLPARRAAHDPAVLIESLGLAQAIESLHQRFGLLIVDSPPMLASMDASELVAHCDAVLLVVRARMTTVEALDRVVERIDASKLIGTVLTRAARTDLG